MAWHSPSSRNWFAEKLASGCLSHWPSKTKLLKYDYFQKKWRGQTKKCLEAHQWSISVIMTFQVFWEFFRIHQWGNVCSPGNESLASISPPEDLTLLDYLPLSICSLHYCLFFLSRSWEEGDYGGLRACWSEIWFVSSHPRGQLTAESTHPFLCW